MGSLSKILNDKLLLIFLLIIILLGVYLRFDNILETGYWVDDQAAIPAGLMWFYPHTYFPGLNYGNPPLGDLIIGAGCMLSGQDFSAVSQVKPFFYPDRFDLLGEPLSKSDLQCHIPMYIFGLIFFIAAVIFAFTFFGKYSALFLTSFSAFHPTLLKASRWIKVDVIFWTFIMIFLFFLLKFYYTDKREYLYLILSSTFLGLAFATKFTGAMFFIFAFLILLEKYKKEFLSVLKIISKKLNLSLLQNLEYKSPKKLIYQSSLFTIIFIFISLIPYKLNPLNLIRTQQIYQQFNQNIGGITVKPFNIFNTLKEFVFSLNIIDTLLFLFSFYILIKLLIKKDKKKLEKFILILFLVLILTALFFPIIIAIFRSFPFLFSIIFIMALAFSNKEYSIFKLLNLHNKKLFFSIFLILYVTFSSIIAIQASPYFVTKNQIACSLASNDYHCQLSLGGFETKELANYLRPLLNDEETFVGFAGIIFFYLKPEQGSLDYNFDNAFGQQVGRYPTILEKAQFFSPNNQTVRYIVIPPDYEGEDEATKAFIKQAKPIKRLKLKDKEVAIIYDIKNL